MIMDCTISDIQFEKDYMVLNGKKIKKTKRSSIYGQRDIYFVGPYVYKIENSDSTFECHHEIAMWNGRIEEKDKKYFAPIIEYGIYNERAWLKTLYYEFIDFNKIEYAHLTPTPKYFEEINKIIKKYGIGWDIFCEKGDMFNCGVTSNGNIIIYDYGEF